MKIGIFDSGIGGLTVFYEIATSLPEYDYIYLGDNAQAPYGNRSQEEIYEFTKRGITWLFEQGALLTLLACNTASSQALRKLQQEWLPHYFPERRILGVIIPIAEEAVKHSEGVIGVVGTKATIESQTYPKELRKLRRDLKIVQISIPELVKLVEQGASEHEIRALLGIPRLVLKQARIDTLILGCTHYSLFHGLFREVMGEEVFLPNVNEVVAQKLVSYLNHHPEIENQLSKNSTRQFFTTGDPATFSQLSERFFTRPVKVQTVSI